MKKASKTSKQGPHFHQMVSALAPSAVRVGSALAAAGQRQITAAATKTFHAQLASDLRQIEKTDATFQNGKLPKGVTDHVSYAKAIHCARLAVYGAATALAAVGAHDAGHDPEPLVALTRALNSAMTGSGIEAKKLRPYQSSPNTPEPHEQALRARLVCLVELVEDDRTKLRRLYDAAEKSGLIRTEARKIVDNARAGRLKDENFARLRQFEKARLEPLIDSGQAAEDLLDPP